MKNRQIVTSLNKVQVPIDRKEAMLNSILHQVDAEYASAGLNNRLEKEQEVNTNTQGGYRKPIRRKTLAILIAASILLLAAGTAAALYLSYLAQIQERESSKTDQVMQQQAQDAYSAYHVDEQGERILVAQSTELGAVTATLKEAAIHPEGTERNVMITLDFSGDAQHQFGTNPDSLDLPNQYALAVDGAVHFPVAWNVASAGYDPSRGHFSTLHIWYAILPAPEHGAQMELSGMAYDFSGGTDAPAIAGEFRFRFAYSEDAAQTHMEEWSQAYTENHRALQSKVTEKLDGLADSVSIVDVTGGSNTVAEIARDGNAFYLVWLYSREHYPDGAVTNQSPSNFVIDGYRCETGGDILWMDELNNSYLYAIYGPIRTGFEEAHLPLRSLITFDDWDGGNVYAFQYEWATGGVTLPPDQTKAREWYDGNIAASERMGGTFTVSSEARQTIGDITIDNVSFVFDESNGSMTMICDIDGTRLRETELTYPRVSIHGQEALWYDVPQMDRIAALLKENATLFRDAERQRCQSMLHCSQPIRYGLLPNEFTIDVVWDYYDIDDNGSICHVGTFTFSLPLQKQK